MRRAVEWPRLDFRAQVPETRRVPIPRHIAMSGLFALALAPACRAAPGPDDAPLGAAGTGSAIAEARGVELRIPDGAGEIAARADTLALDGDGNAVLGGDVRVSVGGARFEARGERLEISDGGRRISFSGRVRAAFEVGPDGGAGR